MDAATYTSLLLSLSATIKSQILDSNIGQSRVRTRYITSEGSDDEQWLANLRDENGKTDIFIMTFTSLDGVKENDRGNQAVGTFTKPISMALDLFYDYKQGLDYTADGMGVTVTTNSEREFLEKVFAVDFALENKKGCLNDNIRIIGWVFRLRIKRFVNSSTHWLNGTLNLEIQDVIL